MVHLNNGTLEQWDILLIGYLFGGHFQNLFIFLNVRIKNVAYWRHVHIVAEVK